MTVIPLLARLLTRSRLIGSMRAMPDPDTLVPRKRYLGGLVPGLQLWTVPDRVRGIVWAITMHLTVSVNRNDFPQRLIEKFGFRPNRLRVIYNGVEMPDRLPTQEEGAAIRSRYGFSAAEFIVCYFGRISSEKGIHYLLEAMVGLPAHVRLLVIGEGPEENAIRELSHSLGIAHRVHFSGFLSNPELVVAACDLVAVPSTVYEAFGRTVVEALAHQVPVVASQIGGMAELFVDGEHGIYVPPGDTDALRRALMTLADNPKLALQMGINGRGWVLSRYSMERVAHDYFALYDELTTKPSAV